MWSPAARPFRARPAAVVALLAAACAPDPGDAAAGPTIAGDPAAEGGAPLPAGAIELNIEVTAPTEQALFCSFRRMDNPEPVHVTGADVTLYGPGAHHASISSTPVEKEQVEPEMCLIDFMRDPLLYLGLDPGIVNRLRLPAGAAFRFAPRQMIKLDMHTINVTGAPAQAGGDIVLYTAPEAGIEHRLDTLFTVIDDRTVVPQGQTGMIGPRWQPIEAGWMLFTMTAHTHGLGTRVTISRSRGEDDPGEVLVEMADDHAPYWPPVPFDPPLVFGEGEGIRVECEHLNTTPGPLSVGGPRNQEMCGFWATYDTPGTRHRVCLIGGDEGRRCCEVGSPDCDAYYGNLEPPDVPR